MAMTRRAARATVEERRGMPLLSWWAVVSTERTECLYSPFGPGQRLQHPLDLTEANHCRRPTLILF